MSPRPPCVQPGCHLDRAPRLQRCKWHALLRKPAAEQLAAAEARVAATAASARTDPGRESWPSGWRWTSCGCGMVPLIYATAARCKAHASQAAHASKIASTYVISDGAGGHRPFTGEDYAALLRAQDGRCALCRRKEGKRRMAIDHDHKTGLVRGLLCSDDQFGCNAKVVARFDADVDPIAMVARLADYLSGKTPAETHVRALAGTEEPQGSWDPWG